MNPQRRSWLKCMVAPLGTSRLIQKIADENAELIDEAARLKEKIGALEMAAEADKREHKIEVSRISEENRALSAEIEHLTQKLDDAYIDNDEIQKIADAIEQFRVERENFRLRIKSLKMHLADARKALKDRSVKDFDDAPDPIDMNIIESNMKPPAVRKKEATPAPPTIPPKKQIRQIDPDNWLQQLPDNL